VGRFEAVEPRMLFSASLVDGLIETPSALSTPASVTLPAGFVAVGQQPDGQLSDKIVYVHGGHGYTANNLGNGAWTTQRGNVAGTDIVEDLGNQDQMTFLVDYLWNAGATVVPLRPVGNQTNEYVLDNDDVEVTFTGAWSNSSSSIYFGDVGDVPYRFASTSATETATAEYRPNIAEAGHYPVYAWTRYGSDRAADQIYRVHHSGGATEVTVNHRMVGNGLVYLGTYYFAQGSDGYVEISNQSSESGRVVIADMIRFGNGVGDIDRGGGVSGQAREDEAALYWIKWQVDRSQGIPDSEYRTSSSDRTATVSASPRYAEYMNRSAEGSLSDRVFISFHSNGGNGNGRGILALYNGNNDPNAATPNQFFLANTVGRQVNDDLVDQNGTFEHDWFDRGATVTLDRSDIEFGEINNNRINNEFDATIIETGFHDNLLDADLLAAVNVRDAIGRATYQGVVEYFNAVDGGATSIVDLPPPVADLRVVSPVAGLAVLSWTPPVANSYAGGVATGYMVYQSADGYGYDGGTFVAGGSSSNFLVTNLDPADGARYFKVAAVNGGGESLAHDTVAVLAAGATVGSNSGGRVLIVNGFDRTSRTLNPTQPFPNPGSTNTVNRVRRGLSNSRDYAIQHAEAIEAYGNGLVSIDTVQNEAVINGQVALSNYDAVFWISGEESTADSTFDAAEQSALITYVSNGGHLFASGAEIGWDLDLFNNGQQFYNLILRADYVADDAGTYAATGAAGSIFAGIDLSFDTRDTVYNAQFPDVIAPSLGSIAALSYVGGSGGTAAVQFDGSGGGTGNVVTFGFPFETIADIADANAVMAAALEFFNISDTAVAATVEAREIFFNFSSLDGFTPGPDAQDDNAIQNNKQALLPGEAASFANYTESDLGINGVMIDIANLANPGSLSASDFVFRVGPGGDTSTWTAAPAPQSITVRQGEGANGSDRVTIIWDSQVIEDQWLEVTVLANANTGLAGADVHYWGDNVGATGDFNADGIVSQGDLDLVLLNWGGSIADQAVQDNWHSQLPVGVIAQARLDDVLLNWGNLLFAPEPPAVAITAPAMSVAAPPAASASVTTPPSAAAEALPVEEAELGAVDLEVVEAVEAVEPRAAIEPAEAVLASPAVEASQPSPTTTSPLSARAQAQNQWAYAAWVRSLRQPATYDFSARQSSSAAESADESLDHDWLPVARVAAQGDGGFNRSAR